MATQWYWRDRDVERGPISFRDLVTMVHNEVLNENDLVRPHYSLNWQEAASVVGLFHMARRADVLLKWEEERRLDEMARRESQLALPGSNSDAINVNDLDDMLRLADVLSVADEPSWRARLREAERQRELENQQRHEELVSYHVKQQKDQAIAAAVANQESKEVIERHLWRWLALPTIDPREVVRTGLQWGLTVGTLNLVGWGIHSWSEFKALRFPDAEATASQLQHFPLWGPCTAGVYAFLLIDTLLITGLVAFAGSRCLINLANE